ncbi:ABC transporter ATP-binding protein [Paenibacillaceae bacterium]|nr:ABC transporter ATP-binding protein [Paenibacillaceae bacterium]
MILDVRDVKKVFSVRGKSDVIANDEITCNINSGEIFGLFGHNGAGKTTLVNQILGVETPTSGEIRLLGESVAKSPARARTLCSVQPQSQLPLGFLTPAQAVTLIGKMRLGSKHDVRRRMEMLFELLDIGQWAQTEGTRLSGGVRRLTAFCMAVIVPGKLVILDEPTNDVDPVRRRRLWEAIRTLTDDGTSVILVTHNVLEAEKAVDRVAILHQGKILAQGTPAEVKSRVKNQMRLELSLTDQWEEEMIPSWALSPHRSGERMIFTVRPEQIAVAAAWAEQQVSEGRMMDFALSPTTLEDVYIELTGKEIGAV